ncbi:MAG: error-prone polymerase, partial [Actinomycetota bacterium]
MGFHNPPVPWSEIEARLSNGRAPSSVSWNAGGDGPAFGAKRQPFEPRVERTDSVHPYAELHCRSNFSFLSGASHPEQLVERAAALGLEALALTDRDGLYGIVRFAEAARAVGLRTMFGVEFSCDGFPGSAPAGDAVAGDMVLLARGTRGYAGMARAISDAQLAGSKGAPRFSLDRVADTVGNGCFVLTGGSDGVVPRALVNEGPSAAERRLRALAERFGPDAVFVELWNHGDPLDVARNDALAQVAARVGVECVATNNVSYAVASQHRLAAALAAVRERSSLDDIDHRLPAAATACLRSGSEQTRRM